MSAEDSKQKWNARYREAESAMPAPVWVLQNNMHLLPKQGKALDLACGLGGNAILLAEQGLEVDAWDIADQAIMRLKAASADRSLPIHAQVRDVQQQPPPPASYDVITVSYFLERELMPAIRAALKPGGLLFYQTFTQQRVSDRGPRRDDFRLAPQELLQMAADCIVIYYREDGLVGNHQAGLRDQACMVIQRPA